MLVKGLTEGLEGLKKRLVKGLKEGREEEELKVKEEEAVC